MKNLISTIYRKEIRAGRVLDYMYIAFISVLMLYMKVAFATPLIGVFLYNRFVMPIWNHEEERYLYILMGYDMMAAIYKINKKLLFFECVGIFIFVGIFFWDVIVFRHFIDFMSFILLFSFLGDFLFTITIQITKNKLYQKLFSFFVLTFVGGALSMVLVLNEYFGVFSPILVSFGFFFLFFIIHIFMTRYFFKELNFKSYL